MSIAHFANAAMVAASAGGGFVALWDGSLPVTFAQGDAVQAGSDTDLGLVMDFAKSTKDRIIASNRDFDTGGADAGAAQIYVRNGSVWDLEQTLQKAVPVAADLYGSSVCMNGDGTTAVVTWAGNVVGQTNVHVWTRVGSVWSIIQTITTTFASNFTTDSLLSSDGGVLCLRMPNKGTIEIWRWGGASYALEISIDSPQSLSNTFAASFWISEDGKFLGATDSVRGSFYVWENTTGSTWALRPYAGVGVGNNTIRFDGMGMSGDGNLVSIVNSGLTVLNTWEWDGAAYQKISNNLTVPAFPSAARMSSSGQQIAVDVASGENVDMFEGEGDVPYVSSGVQSPISPTGTGRGKTISYDGRMIVVGSDNWSGEGRVFSMEV